MDAKSPLLFESRICTRCGGSGEFSSNMMHGTMCYGCRGKKWQLTKRGLAAQNLYVGMLTVRLEMLAVGETLRVEDGFFGQKVWWGEITAIKIGTPKELEIGYVIGEEQRLHYSIELVEVVKPGIQREPKTMTYSGLIGNGERFRKAWTVEQKAEFKQKCLAYQATLTVQGRPNKRKKKEMV